jgi:hypothetical protein
MMEYKKSSFCTGTATCVGVGEDGDDRVVIDLKNPEGPTIVFEADAWKEFLIGAKAGEFEFE